MTGYRTAAAQDVIDAGKEAAGLGLTGASVGDLVRVNAVDSNGKPTSWRKAPLCEIKCNKNLLDNWYFVGGGSQLGDGVFPINQRGQTTYSNTGYGIDRWKAGTGNSVTLNSDSITVTNTSDHSWNMFDQIVQRKFKAGTILTFSAFIKKNTPYTTSQYILSVYTVNGSENVGNVYQQNTDFAVRSVTFTMPYDDYLKVAIRVKSANYTPGNDSADIKAVKLEIGSEQTLCHNEGTEANPVWVLNEVPDYGEELTKCQTSRADSTDTYANQEIAIINRNAGAHNSIYRGKYLGSSVTTEQYAAINAGTFDDLYIGDYWTIGGVNYRIAAFDYWLRTGDRACTTHHVVIVPDTYLYNAQMNTSDVVTGAYVGSKMYTTNLAQAKTTINNAFGAAHVLNHREYLKNAVSSNYEVSGAFYDSTVELMTEQMVYGDKNFANYRQGGYSSAQYTIDKGQFPLFALEHSRIGIRASCWLRDVSSSTDFAYIGFYGNSDTNSSSNTFGVRPTFGICA